ncbi:MAG TPA: peptidyl-prolyl cis-trans isomerase, partial [Acidobacteriota bacterium]
MKTKTAAVLAIALAWSCSKAPSPSEDVVASYHGGEIGFKEVEAEVLARPRDSQAQRDVAALLQRYRDTSEDLVVRHLIRAQPAELVRAEQRWGRELEGLRRQVIAQAYVTSVFGPPQPIAEADLRDYYETHRDEFYRPARRFVLHIFKRHAPGDSEGAAARFLHRLRQRVLAGERFEDLTRYSDSETRRLQGQLGWLERGTLPPALDRVVFALEEGEVSEPIAVAGGAVLFQVNTLVEPLQYPLADVRSQIEQKLQSERIEKRVEELVADLELPAGALVLNRPAIAAAFEHPRAKPVLALGDYRLTAADVRELATQYYRSLEKPLTPAELVQYYETLARQQLLYLKATQADFPDSPEQRRQLDQVIERVRQAFVDEKLLEDLIWRQIDASEPELRAFHRQNAARFQRPLRLKLRALIVPSLEHAQSTLVQLEALRQRSLTEKVDLRTAAPALGARVQELGWIDFSGLMRLPGKVRSYVLELDGTGLTIPFQLEGSLRLIEVIERGEPKPLDFEAAREQVREQYFERHGQRIYEQVKQKMLAEADFSFFADHVRSRLQT